VTYFLSDVSERALEASKESSKGGLAVVDLERSMVAYSKSLNLEASLAMLRGLVGGGSLGRSSGSDVLPRSSVTYVREALELSLFLEEEVASAALRRCFLSNPAKGVLTFCALTLVFLDIVTELLGALVLGIISSSLSFSFFLLSAISISSTSCKVSLSFSLVPSSGLKILRWRGWGVVGSASM
jgi:hypothetical protein